MAACKREPYIGVITSAPTANMPTDGFAALRQALDNSVCYCGVDPIAIVTLRQDEARRMLDALTTPPPASQERGGDDHVRKLVGKLDQWRTCMSYNESYFGEPAGLVKSTVVELARAVDPIYPPKAEPADPLAGVTIHTATVSLAASPPSSAAEHRLEMFTKSPGLHEDGCPLSGTPNLYASCDCGLGAAEQAKPDECHCPQHGGWIASDDVKRLVREIDVYLNGEAGAAKQASLCDIAGQLRRYSQEHGPLFHVAEQAQAGELPMTDKEVERWIDACNYENARQVLRDYLRLRRLAVG